MKEVRSHNGHVKNQKKKVWLETQPLLTKNTSSVRNSCHYKNSCCYPDPNVCLMHSKIAKKNRDHIGV